MYKSPIEIIYGQMETQMEGDILRAVQKYGINVDKDELIRALEYDRDQYDKGYADAMVSIVRCKDCKHLVLTDDGEHNPCDCVCDYWMVDGLNDYDFCSYGERREGE